MKGEDVAKTTKRLCFVGENGVALRLRKSLLRRRRFVVQLFRVGKGRGRGKFGKTRQASKLEQRLETVSASKFLTPSGVSTKELEGRAERAEERRGGLFGDNGGGCEDGGEELAPLLGSWIVSAGECCERERRSTQFGSKPATLFGR
jgi:hypothetical protein